MADAPPPSRLSDWLAVFAPAYRGQMALMAGLNVLSAVAVFVELQLLRALTVVLSRDLPADGGTCGLGQWASSGFSLEEPACAGRLPYFLLAIYTVSVLLQSAVDLLAFRANVRLSQRARRDVERELLRNLLRQDDAFYLRRAPSEIISRLGSDLQRVGGRRQIVTQSVATALSVIAIAWVLIDQSLLAAAIGLAISVLGVLASQPILRRLRDLDRDAIMGDEQVKAAFEDTLQGVAEIQVSGLTGRVLGAFATRQTARDRMAIRYADLNNVNTVSQKLTFTFGFIAILGLFVVTDLFRGDGADSAGLIVVLISTLPQLYFKFGELTTLLTQFQIADVSAQRLRQYDAPPPPPRATASEPGAAGGGGISVRGVRYQFTAGSAVQGGPDGITCDLPPRGMTGIVGPAGAGKSTFVRLVLGRQAPTEGSIIYPPLAPRPDATREPPLFVYLPQRPIIFDTTMRENLLLDDGAASPAFLAARDKFARLGLLDLIRRKGLDAQPTRPDAVADILGIRRGVRMAVEAELGTALHPLGPGRCAPRQWVIENQLGLAIDQADLARRLTSPMSREPVRQLAALPYGRAAATIARDVVRRSAPLLAQASTPDDYNRIAAVPIEMGIWQVRTAALDLLMGGASDPDPTPHPLLVAVALSAKVEELEGDDPPPITPGEHTLLAGLVRGIATPFDEAALNPRLTWRENLIFAATDRANIRRLAQVDRLLLDLLPRSPVEPAIVDAGLDTPVGRLGGRLSGGQQQIVALGRALLNRAPFMVLDEPSSALHPQLRTDLIATLRDEAAERSVIVITHDMALARTCDRLLFVRDGAVAGDGRWADLERDNPVFAEWVRAAEMGAA